MNGRKYPKEIYEKQVVKTKFPDGPPDLEIHVMYDPETTELIFGFYDQPITNRKKLKKMYSAYKTWILKKLFDRLIFEEWYQYCAIVDEVLKERMINGVDEELLYGRSEYV